MTADHVEEVKNSHAALEFVESQSINGEPASERRREQENVVEANHSLKVRRFLDIKSVFIIADCDVRGEVGFELSGRGSH
jgi:hypothetical protein